ncbi:MAG: hypothetical protein KDD65_17845 [Bacteroidetes bacterium]|nr:hypothetical protein [Bacteroidota bacterium]
MIAGLAVEKALCILSDDLTISQLGSQLRKRKITRLENVSSDLRMFQATKRFSPYFGENSFKSRIWRAGHRTATVGPSLKTLSERDFCWFNFSSIQFFEIAKLPKRGSFLPENADNPEPDHADARPLPTRYAALALHGHLLK